MLLIYSVSLLLQYITVASSDHSHSFTVPNHILFLLSVYLPASVSQFLPADHVFIHIISCLSLLFMQKLAVLKDGFQLDSGSQQELWGSSPSLANSELSIPRLYSDAGSQTDIPAEVSPGQDLCFSDRKKVFVFTVHLFRQH